MVQVIPPPYSTCCFNSAPATLFAGSQHLRFFLVRYDTPVHVVCILRGRVHDSDVLVASIFKHVLLRPFLVVCIDLAHYISVRIPGHDQWSGLRMGNAGSLNQIWQSNLTCSFNAKRTGHVALRAISHVAWDNILITLE